MNRQGALVHWILLGMFAALAVFFIAARAGVQAPAIKGEWALQFLNENYLEAQKEQLQMEIRVRNAGIEIARELAGQGGFESASTCGAVDDVSLWNKEERWCWPDLAGAVNAKAQEKLLPFIQFGNKGTIFFGKGREKTIKSPTGKYTYDTSFSLDLGYSFDEYLLLEETARHLVDTCRNTKNLIVCLEETKKKEWEYGKCGSLEQYPANSRLLAFCIQSVYDLPFGEEYIRSFQAVHYQIALDFANTLPFEVDNLGVQSFPDFYEITFDADPAAEKYRIYYTNWGEAVNNAPGSPPEIFSTVPSNELLGFYGKIELEQPTECAFQKEAGKAYLCEGKIVYRVQDSRITPDREFWFAATTLSQNKESLLVRFVSVLPTPNGIGS
ncbi:hypothetical protein HYX14_01655 [Candidatus Woesearchaeota archaeon]|nr:hypothetical protein [Candidatus Woesearchaeota archaeon]